VKDTGDVSYLRRRNDELSAQLRETKKEESRLQTCLKEADMKIDQLNTENCTLRKRIGSKPSYSVDPEKPAPPTRERMDTPRRTPMKKQPKKKSFRKESSIIESLQDCDDRLQAISKYDEKIARFEEILQQMRTDLSGSMEAVTQKVTRSASVIDPPRRGTPKFVSDIQLVPPRSTANQEPEAVTQEEIEPFADLDTWTEVTNRRSQKKQVRIQDKRSYEEELPNSGAIAGGSDRRPPITGGVRRRAPRNAAVSIKVNPEGPSYAEIIKQARESVNLKEFGITNPRMRRAANGGVLIEIAGPEGAAKANTLAARLKDVIGGNATVSRSIVKADFRIVGFDESVIKDEILTVLSENGGCLTSKIRVGPFRQMRNGLMMSWIQCPLSAALRVSRKGRVNLGWSVARVELMKAKPVQCYKCWHFDHVRNNCSSSVDRTGHCFKCGGTNHSSYTCQLSPYCVICAECRYESAHRFGSPACLAMVRGPIRNLRN